MWKSKRSYLVFKWNTTLFLAGLKVLLHKPYYITTALVILFLVLEDGIRCGWKGMSLEDDVISMKLMKINRFLLPKKYHVAWNYLTNEEDINKIDPNLRELIKKNTENLQKLWYLECENLGLDMNKIKRRASL